MIKPDETDHDCYSTGLVGQVESGLACISPAARLLKHGRAPFSKSMDRLFPRAKMRSVVNRVNDAGPEAGFTLDPESSGGRAITQYRYSFHIITHECWSLLGTFCEHHRSVTRAVGRKTL